MHDTPQSSSVSVNKQQPTDTTAEQQLAPSSSSTKVAPEIGSSVSMETGQILRPQVQHPHRPVQSTTTPWLSCAAEALCRRCKHSSRQLAPALRKVRASPRSRLANDPNPGNGLVPLQPRRQRRQDRHCSMAHHRGGCNRRDGGSGGRDALAQSCYGRQTLRCFCAPRQRCNADAKDTDG